MDVNISEFSSKILNNSIHEDYALDKNGIYDMYSLVYSI